jgi:Mlc titration factor MtfA (ptsG expression regulator)
MVFALFRRWRLRRILAQPFPDAWRDILSQRFEHYERLAPDDRKRLERDVQIFIADKNWEGCAGFEITDEVKVIIAANACLLLLGHDHDGFANVRSVLVYPRPFRVPEFPSMEDGLYIVDEDVDLVGEAHERGPVILSWNEVQRAGHGGRNVVLHEFAHKLDMADGFVDGTPPLAGGSQVRQWAAVMTDEFNMLRDSARRGRATLLDDYGAQDEAEFFAVATECFFERSQAMQRRHAALYDVLKAYFNQDPASR